MLPLMQAECLGAQWVTEEQFIEGLAVGNALPGPISTKMAVFVGWKVAGFWGACSALIGVVVPTALLMGLLGAFVIEYRENRWVAAALRGVKPAVIGMLFWVAFALAPAGISGLRPFVLAIAAFAALSGGLHPAIVMLCSIVIGVVFFQ